MAPKTGALADDVIIILNTTEFPDDEDELTGLSGSGSGDGDNNAHTLKPTGLGLVNSTSTEDQKTPADDDSSNFLIGALGSVAAVIAVFAIVFFIIYCRRRAVARKSKKISESRNQNADLARARANNNQNNGRSNNGGNGGNSEPSIKTTSTTLSSRTPEPPIPLQPLKARPSDWIDTSIPPFLTARPKENPYDDPQDRQNSSIVGHDEPLDTKNDDVIGKNLTCQ